MKTILSTHNKKLGRLSSFSLPLSSCNKKYTKQCRKYCYANHLFRLYPKYKKKMSYNLVATKRADFVERIVDELKDATNNVRVHVSGDFFSQWYLDKWKDIARKSPNHRFYGYTKSLDLDYSNRPGNLIIYLSDDQLKLQDQYARFDGVTTISFDKKPIRGFRLCLHQKEGLTCSRCGLCMVKGNKIYFNKH